MPIRRDHMWFCIYFIYLYTCLYQCNGQELSCDQYPFTHCYACILVKFCWWFVTLRNPVKITGSQSYIEVDGNRSVLFPWNGIGYSPVPNSDGMCIAFCLPRGPTNVISQRLGSSSIWRLLSKCVLCSVAGKRLPTDAKHECKSKHTYYKHQLMRVVRYQ